MNEGFNKTDLLKCSSFESAPISCSLSTEALEILKTYPEFKPDILLLELEYYHRRFDQHAQKLCDVTEIVKQLTGG